MNICKWSCECHRWKPSQEKIPIETTLNTFTTFLIPVAMFTGPLQEYLRNKLIGKLLINHAVFNDRTPFICVCLHRDLGNNFDFASYELKIAQDENCWNLWHNASILLKFGGPVLAYVRNKYLNFQFSTLKTQPTIIKRFMLSKIMNHLRIACREQG